MSAGAVGGWPKLLGTFNCYPSRLGGKKKKVSVMASNGWRTTGGLAPDGLPSNDDTPMVDCMRISLTLGS